MTLRKSYQDFEIFIFNDTLYDPNSRDNSREYENIYEDQHYDDYAYITRHGIHLLQDGEILTSALLISSGGITGIHETCSVIDFDKLVVCCADSVFCLALPNLNLLWQRKADSATCFEIFNHSDSYIVHGELEISNLDKEGHIVWQFSGTDIFATANHYGDFKIKENLIIAKNWEGMEYSLDVETGKLIKVTSVR